MKFQSGDIAEGQPPWKYSGLASNAVASCRPLAHNQGKRKAGSIPASSTNFQPHSNVLGLGLFDSLPGANTSGRVTPTGTVPVACEGQALRGICREGPKPLRSLIVPAQSR